MFALRIGGRLYGGFGALMLLGAVLAGFAVWQFWAVQTQVVLMSSRFGNAVSAGVAATDLQAARRALVGYMFDQDEASFAESETRLSKAAKYFEEGARGSPSAERRAMYRTALNEMAELMTKRVALGEALSQMQAGRVLMFTDGKKMSADVRKLVEAADKTQLSREVSALETAILQVQLANWRMLANRDAEGIASFKTNVANAQRQIAELEKADLPSDSGALLASVKTGVGNYAAAFEKTGPNLLFGDQLYYKTFAPVIAGMIEKMDGARTAIGESLQKVADETDSRISRTVTTQEIVAGGTLLIGLLIALLIARGIIGPLSRLTAGMEELAGGNFDVVLPGLDRKDEVGDMAQAVENFKVKAAEKARDETEARIAQDQVAAQRRKADMIRLANDFEGAVGEIIDTVSSASTELEASARTLSSTSERSQHLTTMVATASEEASTNVQSVASATEEMASSVNEISRQVQTSATIANEAVVQARKTNDRVGELAKAASRIGDVVELINTIAGQTNLLALNATIEAARAGEAGRGFAVVASEVKALAEQTAKATGEISQQITGIQAATHDSVAAIKEIGDTIGKMSEIASTIASAVEEQGAATQEIARNVQQAAQGTQQVSANITDVQRGTSETGSASSQVLSAAQSLSRDSNRLKTEVGKFLNTVRAA